MFSPDLAGPYTPDETVASLMKQLGLTDLKVLMEGGAGDDDAFAMGAAALGFIPDLGPDVPAPASAALLVSSLAKLANGYLPHSDGERMFQPRGIKECIRRPHAAHLIPDTFKKIARLLQVATYQFLVRSCRAYAQQPVFVVGLPVLAELRWQPHIPSAVCLRAPYPHTHTPLMLTPMLVAAKRLSAGGHADR